MPIEKDEEDFDSKKFERMIDFYAEELWETPEGKSLLSREALVLHSEMVAPFRPRKNAGRARLTRATHLFRR